MQDLTPTSACAPPRRTLDDTVSPSTIRLKRASTIAEIRMGRTATAAGGVWAGTARAQDPAAGVWALCGDQARAAGAGQARNVQVLGVCIHLRAKPGRWLPTQAQEPVGPDARETAGDQGRITQADASAGGPTGALVEAGGAGLQRIPRGAN